MCSDTNKNILLPCPMVQVTPSWILVSTSSNAVLGAAAASAVNLPFALWDSTTLVVSRSFDTVCSLLLFVSRHCRIGGLLCALFLQLYNYAVFPVITGISGCMPRRRDPDTLAIVNTVDCPTVGNVTLTITGFFFGIPGPNPPIVVVGSTLTSGIILPFFDGTNRSVVTCVLPPGIGADLNVTVRVS